MQFNVIIACWEYVNRGTKSESRVIDSAHSTTSGPFASRASAEVFARNMATQPHVAQVNIEATE